MCESMFERNAQRPSYIGEATKQTLDVDKFVCLLENFLHKFYEDFYTQQSDLLLVWPTMRNDDDDDDDDVDFDNHKKQQKNVAKKSKRLRRYRIRKMKYSRQHRHCIMCHQNKDFKHIYFSSGFSYLTTLHFILRQFIQKFIRLCAPLSLFAIIRLCMH